MAILATSAQLNPMLPPIPPVDPTQIIGFYMIWDNYNCESVVCVAPSEEIALEIAAYLYGRNGTYYLIYDNAINPVLRDVELIRKSGLVKGYVTPQGKIVVYKTRTEIIDEVLTELN